MNAAEAATAIATPKPAAGHRGRIEVVEFGTRFLLVSGWVTGPGRPCARRRHLARPARWQHVSGRRLPPPARPGRTRHRQRAMRLPARHPAPDGADRGAEHRAPRRGAGAAGAAPVRTSPRAPSGRAAISTMSRPTASAGWAFDPAQWHGPAEEAALELVVDGEARIPLSLNATRRDLPFATVQRGGQLGFDFGLQDIARLMAAAGLERDLLEGDHAYALTVRRPADRRAAGQQHPPRPAAATRRASRHRPGARRRGRRRARRLRRLARLQQGAGRLVLRRLAARGSAAGCRDLPRHRPLRGRHDRDRGGDQRLSPAGHQRPRPRLHRLPAERAERSRAAAGAGGHAGRGAAAQPLARHRPDAGRPSWWRWCACCSAPRPASRRPRC